MGKQKLLIAESTEELRTILSDLFRGTFQVFSCGDGCEAQKLLTQFCPDLMIVDVMLPGFDGISLIQWALEQGIRSRVLLLTRFASDYVMEAAGRLNVSYVMMKPCDLGALAARVTDMSRALPPAGIVGEDPQSRVSGILLALGLPHEIAHGSLRLSLSEDNTMEECDYVVDSLKEIVARLREMSPLYADAIESGEIEA